MKINIDRATVEQALEALEYGQHSLKQISEHQWESRGQLAMDALRAALAQQAEPVADLRCAKWLDPECADKGACQSLRFKRQAAQEQAEPVEPVAQVAAAQVEAERERIFAHIRSAMGHAEAGYDNVAWRLLARLVGPNVGIEPRPR